MSSQNDQSRRNEDLLRTVFDILQSNGAQAFLNAASAYAEIRARGILPAVQPAQSVINETIEIFRRMSFHRFVGLITARNRQVEYRFEDEEEEEGTSTNGRFAPSQEAKDKVRRNLEKEFW